MLRSPLDIELQRIDLRNWIDAQQDEAADESEARAAIREYGYYKSYREIWGVFTPIRHSLATGGWAYGVMLALLAAYFTEWGMLSW